MKNLPLAPCRPPATSPPEPWAGCETSEGRDEGHADSTPKTISNRPRPRPGPLKRRPILRNITAPSRPHNGSASPRSRPDNARAPPSHPPPLPAGFLARPHPRQPFLPATPRSLSLADPSRPPLRAHISPSSSAREALRAKEMPTCRRQPQTPRWPKSVAFPWREPRSRSALHRHQCGHGA